jgi:zinc/manganese transport system permease protein
MTDAFSLLWPPFLVALCLVGIHALFGLEILRRNVIFVDLALAQIAALGATVAFMLGHAVGSAGSIAYSLGFALAAAGLLASTRLWSVSARVSQEALIGVIYVVAAAAAFLLVEKAPQGSEHIKQVLIGNILVAGVDELIKVVPLYIVIGGALWLLRERLAKAGGGIRGWCWDFAFYAAFGVVVTSSVSLAGVLLVFSFLIIPAMIGVIYARSAGRQLAVGWLAGGIASGAGLAMSYAWDLPTGAAMVCTFGAALALAAMARPLLMQHHVGRRVCGAARVAIALLLVASGVWFAAAPRADQPLLDIIEYAAPGVRTLYMSEGEQKIFNEAHREAERYRTLAVQLSRNEQDSRWQGAALDDMQVRRISSFMQSYNEMRKGEEFVKREVRARARVAARWWLAALLTMIGVLLAPWRKYCN